MYRLAWLLTPVVLLGQPDARELLRQSAEAIKHYQSYQIDSVVEIETRGGPVDGKMEMPASISVRRPDRMRIESKNQAAGVTIVSDGDHTWFYLTPLKKYIKREAAGLPEAAMGGPGILPANLPDVSKSVHSMAVTGEESIEVAGERVPCWVVETVYERIVLPGSESSIEGGVLTTWIAKEQGLTLRSTFHAVLNLSGQAVQMTQSTRTTALRLNAELPDSLFVFVPPAGAVETADWTLPGIAKPDVLAKPAPEFNGKALDGTQVDLAALHGKVVLLDFWATWCGPCRKDLPAIEKLHKELRDQGLVVLGLNVDEAKAVLEKFLSGAGLTYPILQVDDKSDLIAKLGLNAFPTVVLVDREGKIASYEVGVRGEAALRADLAKLGIGTAPVPDTKPK